VKQLKITLILLSIDPKATAADVSGFNACAEIWRFFRKY
jgi:hypothetical protein